MCASVSGKLRGLQAPRPTSRCCVWRRSLEYAGARPILHYTLQQSWLAGFPAFARSRLGGGTNLLVIHLTPRSGRAMRCASIAGKTPRPAGTAANVQVWHPAPPRGVRGSLAYPSIILRSRACSPALLHSRGLDGAVHHTPRSTRGITCAYAGPETSGSAVTTANVHVRHPALPPGVCGEPCQSLSYPAHQV
ncbi:hypothetical protein MRX96_010100 [Rhipicephalus microplus]